LKCPTAQESKPEGREIEKRQQIDIGLENLCCPTFVFSGGGAMEKIRRFTISKSRCFITANERYAANERGGEGRGKRMPSGRKGGSANRKMQEV